MTDGIYKIVSNQPVADITCRLVLEGETSAITRPGQFVNIKIDGFFLRRPISVCDWEENRLTLIYKVVGKGTEALSRLEAGRQLDLLCGLGNGYDTAKCSGRPLLIGGGAGLPPMYGLAKTLLAEGRRPTVIAGFNRASEIFLRDELEALGCKLIIATADGSVGVNGFVTDAMAGIDYDYICACGPEPMLRAVDAAAKTEGQFSFEERMGCGFGACMGCSCKTKYGSKRICREGPVLERSEIIW